MLDNLRKMENPSSFFARFITQFALGFSACLVAGLIAFLVGRASFPEIVLWSFGFSFLFGLIRAKLAKPGAPFWGPVLNN